MNSDRRQFIRNAAAVVAASANAGTPAEAAERLEAPPQHGKAPFRFIFEAEWNDMPCADYPLTPERWIQECIQPLAGTHVDTLLYNLCSSDAYCCELKHGELLCDSFPQLGNAWVWRYRENTKKIIAADANPPKLAVEYGHRLGLKVIPIVRMNDPHDQYFKYELSRFKRQNPQFLLGYGSYPIDWEKGYKGLPPDKKMGMDAITWGMFDFAHPEVRQHKLAIIEEFITRWDNDGISLDFDRDPRYFKEYGKAENAELMTGLIRDIKTILARTEAQRGRKLYFHVRVIPTIEACYERGLDVRTWVREKLVDAITPGCGYMTVSLDLQSWLQLVAGRECYLYACINHWHTTEETRAWAHLMYSRGAHGVQLFNYGHLLFGHDRNTPPASDRTGTVLYSELAPDYYQVLDELDDVKNFRYKDKRYALESMPHERVEGEGGKTGREFRAIDAIRLPVSLAVGRHPVHFGIADDLASARNEGVNATCTLRLKLQNYTPVDEFDVSINGRPLDRGTRSERAVFIMNDFTWVAYPVPADALHPGINGIEMVVHKLNPQMAVTPILSNLELTVEFGRERHPVSG
jgi:hypothetical protein